jgi:hypothetical protein
MGFAEVDQVLAQLASEEREIINPVSGSPVYAYAQIPYSITAAQMPLFINFVGPLIEETSDGSDDDYLEYIETRSYNCKLFIAPYGSGVEGEKWGDLQPYFKLVYDKLNGYPHMKNIGGIINAKIIADTGMSQLLNFQGQLYYGCVFTLQVSTRVKRLLGANE